MTHHKLPTEFIEVEQPEMYQVAFDGIFVKQILLPMIGFTVPQHVHRYDHYSFLAHGSISAWVDGAYRGSYKAPAPLFIPAGTQHIFMALEDNTIMFCIHNLHGDDEVDLIAEAKPLEGD